MSSYNSELPVLDTYRAVVSAFSDFLTVAIHTILFERDIYPKNSFLRARKYNYPVRQSRHPKVCQWIQDAVAAVEVEMFKCTISSTSLLIYGPTPTSPSTPLERYTFSTHSFPLIPPNEHLKPFAGPLPPAANLPSQFRATIARLSSLSSTLSPLPPDSSFTLIIELRDDHGGGGGSGEGNAPIGNPQPWIAADAGVQRRKGEGRKDTGKVRTVPVRSVDEGPFVMEVWVEEGVDKVAIVEKGEEGVGGEVEGEEGGKEKEGGERGV